MTDADPAPLPLNGPAIAVLTVSHALVDLCQGAVPALMPYFVLVHGLGFAHSATLVLAASLASSVIQPLFGVLADRVSARWIIPASLLATAGGLVAAVLAPGYGIALLAAAISGLGVAAFHPEAARLVHVASRSRRTTGMSYFSVGGNLGFALAPLLVAGLLELTGPGGLALLLAPAIVMAVVAGSRNGRLADMVGVPGTVRREEALPPARWGAFTLLGVVIAIRSAAFVGLSTFLGLYFVKSLGVSTPWANAALAVVLAAGVAGTLLGGRLSDRWGRHVVISGSLLISAGLLAGLAVAPLMLAWVLLVPVGVVLLSAGSAVVVLGQEYLPGRVGVASGVTIGLAVSCGGVAAPLIGLVADGWGVGVVPGMLAGLSLLAGVLALGLPRAEVAGC